MTPRYGKLMESELHGDRTVFCYGDHYFDELHRKINYRVNCLPPSPQVSSINNKTRRMRNEKKKKMKKRKRRKKKGAKNRII